MVVRRRTLRSLASALLVTASIPISPAIADPQSDEVVRLALDYLKNGAKDPTNEQKLAEAGVDLSIGIVSLGLTSVGVPAGPALAALKSVFLSNATTMPSIVDQRFNAIEADLRLVKLDLGQIQDNVNNLNNDLADNTNGDRIDNLAPIKRDIRNATRRLVEAPTMSATAKSNYVEQALDIANEFLPTSTIGAKAWSWDNIRLQANLKSTKKPLVTREVVPDLNLSLETYLYSISVLSAAIKETQARPIEAKLAPHYEFLMALNNLTFEENVRCSVSVGPRELENGRCSKTLTCASPLATRSKSFEFDKYEGPSTGYVPKCVGPARDDPLKFETLKANEPARYLIAAASSALKEAGAPKYQFDSKTSVQTVLFARDPSGKLIKYRHVFTEQESPDCTAASADVRCASEVARSGSLNSSGSMNTGKLERNSVPQSPNAKGPARSPFSALASYQNSGPPKQYTHDYQSLGLQQGDWNYLRLFTSGVSIYGVGRDGRLDWIRLDANGSVAVGPITLDTGWGDYEHVFGGGDGVIYAVNRQGQLLWFKHDDAQIGPAALKGPVVVGGGWAGLFPKVFSAGDGEIFAVRNDGQLFRWKHTGHKDGTPQWEVDANGSQYRQIGEGWDHFTHVFASQKNNIYAIDSAGSLYWYRLGFAGVGDSLSLSRIGSAKWEGPIKIGGGLENSTHVFATMPSSGPAGGVR